MYIVILKSKTTSQYLLEEGVPEWIRVFVGEFENLKDAAKYCKHHNDHTKQFHRERKGKLIYYIKKV